MAANPISDLLMELLSKGGPKGVPMQPSGGLQRYLAERASSQPDLASFESPNVELHPTVNANPNEFPGAPDAEEMLGRAGPISPNQSPVSIWVHHPDGRKARLDGPFASEEEAYATLDEIMRENGDAFTKGISFSLQPETPPT